MNQWVLFDRLCAYAAAAGLHVLLYATDRDIDHVVAVCHPGAEKAITSTFVMAGDYDDAALKCLTTLKRLDPRSAS